MTHEVAAETICVGARSTKDIRQDARETIRKAACATLDRTLEAPAAESLKPYS